MTIRSQTIDVTVAGSAGSATGSASGQGPVNGRVVGVYVGYDGQPDTCDVTITSTYNQPIITLSNNNVSQWFYPRTPDVSIQVAKFGKNPDIDSGVDEDVWSGGGIYPFPTSATTLSVVSNSDQDKSGGTGTTQIFIEGLDINFDPLTETVTLNGLTPVVTTGEFYRVNRMYIMGDVGSNGKNVGTITATHGVAGVISQIDANEGQTLQAIYTVPRGYRGWVQSFGVHVLGNSTAKVEGELYRRVNLGAFAGGWRESRLGTASNTVHLDDTIYNKGSGVTGGDDLRVMVEDASTNNISVTGEFQLYLIPDMLQNATYAESDLIPVDGYIDVSVSGGDAGSVTVVVMVES